MVVTNMKYGSSLSSSALLDVCWAGGSWQGARLAEKSRQSNVKSSAVTELSQNSEESGSAWIIDRIFYPAVNSLLDWKFCNGLSCLYWTLNFIGLVKNVDQTLNGLWIFNSKFLLDCNLSLNREYCIGLRLLIFQTIFAGWTWMIFGTTATWLFVAKHLIFRLRTVLMLHAMTGVLLRSWTSSFTLFRANFLQGGKCEKLQHFLIIWIWPSLVLMNTSTHGSSERVSTGRRANQHRGTGYAVAESRCCWSQGQKKMSLGLWEH